MIRAVNVQRRQSILNITSKLTKLGWGPLRDSFHENFIENKKLENDNMVKSAL